MKGMEGKREGKGTRNYSEAAFLPDAGARRNAPLQLFAAPVRFRFVGFFFFFLLFFFFFSQGGILFFFCFCFRGRGWRRRLLRVVMAW